MRIALLAFGSRGDIQPAIALGDALQRRGHSVVVTVNKNLAPWASRSGLEVVSTEPDVEMFLKSKEARGFLATGNLFEFFEAIKKLEDAANEEIFRACLDASRHADLVLSTILTAQRGMCIAEKSGVPHGCVVTMPSAPTASWASFLSPIRRFPLGTLNHLTHRAILHLFWHQSRKNIARMREHMGLPRLRARLRVEALPTVHVYSQALCARPSDWPAAHEPATFCTLEPELRERLGEGVVPEDLDAWLRDGPAPVFFGLGSMPIADPAAWLESVIDATQKRGLRALVGAGWTDIPTRNLPGHVFVAPVFDHDQVLPRCHAAVHHGGAGTTATVVRAGLPSFVLSVFADQPFWGWRLEVLGIGDTVHFSKLARFGGLDRVLDSILDPAKAEGAKRLGALLRAERGADAAADVVERWGRGSRRSPARREAAAGPVVGWAYRGGRRIDGDPD